MKHVKLSNSPLTNALYRAEKNKTERASSVEFRVCCFARNGQLRQTKKCRKEVLIYFEIKLGKRKKAFSSNIRCRPEQLNTSSFEIIGEPLKTMKLQSMKLEAEKAFLELDLTERNIDFHVIKAHCLGLAKVGIPTLQEVFDLFYIQMEQEVATGGASINTLKKIKTWHKRMKAFITEKYGSGAVVQCIVPNDSKAFVLYLKSVYNYSHNSTQMAVGHFKRVLNFAIENEWLVRNPFMNFRKKFDEKAIEYLNEKEISILENLNLLDERLRRINDVFLFMCYTGLAYIDLQTLRKNHIYEQSTDLYIFKERQKTRTPQTVYLNRKALAILAKYEDDPYCNNYGFLVPILSNQKINSSLKAIQAIAGIEKRVTCHLARKTFATVIYETGADEKTMKAIMGHSNITQTLKHYAKISQKSVVKGLKDAMRKTNFGT